MFRSLKTFRTIADPKSLFLTLDDGPDPDTTEEVLRILERHQSTATFFVITERALSEHSLLREIESAGHTIGNHSLDHRYHHYFRGEKALQEWIEKSESVLKTLRDGKESIGFRPPAGVVTPPLQRALSRTPFSLILWNERFYDSLFRWDLKRARRYR